MFGKAAKQKELLDNMGDVFRKVQRDHHLPIGTTACNHQHLSSYLHFR